MSFGPTGPFRFQTPTEFNGKKENLEEFGLKFKPYLSLRNPTFTAIVNNIETNVASPVTEDHFNDEDGDVQASRVKFGDATPKDLGFIVYGISTSSSSTRGFHK